MSVRATISCGVSFSDLKRVPAIVDAGAAADAVEALIRNSLTAWDIFLIEEMHEDYSELDGLRSSGGSACDIQNLKI